jgi:very-short-patch-repair endonuclease
MRKPSVSQARLLRRNSTDAERVLWWYLRSRQPAGAKFRRQEPIGRYIVDFCCVEHKLIVEVDGGHHAEDRQEEYDRERTAYLERCGYRVLRFWNTEVFGETEGVLGVIWEAIVGSPHPDPLPEGEGTLAGRPGLPKRR